MEDMRRKSIPTEQLLLIQLHILFDECRPTGSDSETDFDFLLNKPRQTSSISALVLPSGGIEVFQLNQFTIGKLVALRLPQWDESDNSGFSEGTNFQESSCNISLRPRTVEPKAVAHTRRLT
ncbi:hypothetical protein T265_01291 [Opisthorchis viverrini]|uniref:Uncharacterized protein n=1 Tax=Opisthorchis viverrini TaxID=6198 RepID=A0A074ZZU5_OPIVI|nr:hypothetical protein T265_01291 [Opisthorchis viverrini]KER32601.1 hypothetical protein T265_01291 [Opisthorchis viverrini]